MSSSVRVPRRGHGVSSGPQRSLAVESRCAFSICGLAHVHGTQLRLSPVRLDAGWLLLSLSPARCNSSGASVSTSMPETAQALSPEKGAAAAMASGAPCAHPRCEFFFQMRADVQVGGSPSTSPNQDATWLLRCSRLANEHRLEKWPMSPSCAPSDEERQDKERHHQVGHHPHGGVHPLALPFPPLSSCASSAPLAPR